VFDTSKLCFVFATELVGLCKRFYSRSLSSTSMSFLPTASFQKHATQNRQHRRQKSGQKTTLLQDTTLLCQRRLLDRQSSYVLSSSTQFCFLRTSHRNVSFYNVFSTLAHGVDKLSVTLFDVIASRFVAHFSYAIQNGQKRFHSTTHLCSIPRRTLNLTTNAPRFYTLGTYT